MWYNVRYLFPCPHNGDGTLIRVILATFVA